jgi:phenylacetate-coenzyme A ligase PaaK-like adenylate-forming protein
MYVNDDLLIVEAVGADEQPVSAGELSDRLLVTSLHQRTLPLIRYRVDDRVAFATEPGRFAAYPRIARIDGRSDDVFHYGDLQVHPHVFRSVLTEPDDVQDYQVIQRPDGAEVLVESRFAVDTDGLAARLTVALCRAGLDGARITVRERARLPRTTAGKRRHFVPMAVEAPGGREAT